MRAAWLTVPASTPHAAHTYCSTGTIILTPRKVILFLDLLNTIFPCPPGQSIPASFMLFPLIPFSVFVKGHKPHPVSFNGKLEVDSGRSINSMVSIDTFCQQKYSNNLNYFLDLIGLDVNYKNQGLRIGWNYFRNRAKNNVMRRLIRME